MSLKSVFNGFKSISKELDGKDISKSFWERDSAITIKQVKKAKKIKIMMCMDRKRFNKLFTI